MPAARVRRDVAVPHRPCGPPPRAGPLRRNAVVLAGTAAFLGSGVVQTVDAQAIRTVVTPEATAVRWDNDLGLRNKAMYGGRVDLEFDRWISLAGYFHTNNGVQTAAEKLGVNAVDAARLGDQRLRLRSYGANVNVQLATGDFVPYIDVGGGVLEFRPDNADRSRQVALNLGGGLRIKLADPLRLDLFAHDAMFRVNRFALFAPSAGGTVPRDPNADDLRHNLVVGAGLGIPFGPSRAEATGSIGGTPWGLNGLSFALEPIAGQLKFDTPNLADQSLVGIRAGFDVGPLVGLRGVYWRGVSDNFSNTDPVQSWSGEAQFRLNAGTGITPFVLIGGGEVDFTSSFRNQANAPERDRTSFIAGAGVAIPLGERLGLDLAARDYMFGGQSDLSDVSSADDLTHNWLWSAGLRFSVGGKRGSAMMRDRRARDERARQQLVAERDSNDARLARRTMRESRGDVVGTRDDTTTMRARTSDYQSGRVVSIPIPSEGELYVRYGPRRDSSSRMARVDSAERVDRVDRVERDGREQSGMSRAELREMVRDAMHDERVDTRIDALRDELARDRMDALRDDLMRSRIDAMTSSTSPSRQTTATPPASRTTRPLTSSGGEVITRSQVRIPVEKNRSGQPEALTRDDVRALIDSLRADDRMRSDSTTARTQRDDNTLLTRVDSIVSMRLQAAEAARRAERDSVAAATRDSLQRERDREAMEQQRIQVERMQAEQAPRGRPDLSILRTTVYGGINVTDGTQAITGLRLDLGPLGRNFSAIHFLPELALGWGAGARTTMVAGNLQLGLFALRIGRLPAITPHIEAGVGILNFSDPIRGRDGTDGVVNLGYGFAADLWRRGAGSAGPTLVVEHQGVDLFNLNRILAGLRWTF